MPPAKSFAAFLLFLSIIDGPNSYAHGAGPLNETEYVVGPEPQPLVRRWPIPSNPFILEAVNGGRKLHGDEILHSFDFGLSRPSVHCDRKAFPVTRSLVGEICNITNTILSVKYDDNGVENGFSFIPPDPHGAAGVSRLVAVVNAMVEVRQKNGQLMYRKGLQSFFSSVPGALDTTKFFDPKVIYDDYAGRFVTLALH
jgi:hypothetical protein